MIKRVLFFLMVGILISVACSPVSTPTQQTNLPNPASVYCEQQGGKLDLRQDSTGGVTGICVFPDSSECEEWSFFRGECKAGDSLKQTTTNTIIAPTETKRGQIVFYSNRAGGYQDVFVLDIATSQLTRLTQGEDNYFSGPFSPDGTRLLFTGFGLTHSYVGVMNADGSDPMDLTNLPDSDEAFPAWSPDGKQIAFTSRRDGNNEIYVMNADGSDAQRLTNAPKDDFAPAWSPDGSKIVFTSDRDNQTGIYSLYVMNVDGTSISRLTKADSSDYAPSWSPDSSAILYYSIRSGQADIYRVNVDGTNEANLTNNPADDTAPRWSPDGKQIAFQTKRDGNWEIYVMDADGSHTINLTNNPADDQSPYWKPTTSLN